MKKAGHKVCRLPYFIEIMYLTVWYWTNNEIIYVSLQLGRKLLHKHGFGSSGSHVRNDKLIYLNISMRNALLLSNKQEQNYELSFRR